MPENESKIPDRWSFRPPDDIKRQVERALKDIGGDDWAKIHGLLSHVITKALRDGLHKQGYSRKKDLAAQQEA